MEDKESKLDKIANAPVETPKRPPSYEPSVFTAVFFSFTGEQDRNVRTNWPGELPRVGETVQLKGRDTIWKISGLQWIFDIDPSEQRFQRAAVISLEKLS
ncbi:MAG: hypothetical protein WC565_02090 [Parcubacteria group bacterium]